MSTFHPTYAEATPPPRARHRRRLLGTAATLALLTAGPASAAVVSNGQGHANLAPDVLAAVDAVMSNSATRIAGMTVAVSRNGRLLLNKGYGHANRANWTEMQPYHRSKIGSVGKAVVSGAALWKLMEEKGVNPATKKVYGPTGVLGTTYAGQQDTGDRRFNPIVSMAIGTDDKVYTWYGDQTYSIGNSTNLQQQTRQPYLIPHGRKPSSIRGIDISRNGTVYTWYDDRSLSRGTPGNLGAIEPPPLDEDGKPTKLYSLAPGRSVQHVIDMAIAKSNDHVYVWYEDGRVSSGTSTDLDLYRPLYSFHTLESPGATSYNIRAFGINRRDRVYAWYTHDLTTRGTTDEPYIGGNATYTFPLIPGATSFEDWYGQMTVQHVLDHKAGFTRSGDVDGAARRYSIPADQLTYHQAHSYMLLTRKLEFEPGTATSYSNHGFGLCTLLVPALANGKSYRDYAIQNYLTPLNLQNKIKPGSATYDANMSRGYGYSDGAFVPRTAKNSGLGLAAGGWTASAEALLRVGKHLTTAYPAAEVDKMGWDSDADGKLAHGGLIKGDGGAAYVALFPQGYEVDGVDVSKIHVALAANTEVSTTALRNLADAIATATAEAGVPAHYDLWAGLSGN